MKLVICEKPSQAGAYAKLLNASKRQDAFWEGGGYIVSWCYGHLVELASADAYGEQYRRWNRDVLPILPGAWQYTASKDKAKQLSVLRSLMKRADVDSIICATDAGREGELIFRLVYDYCKCKKPVERLWISSMEDAAIREGFARLRPGADYDTLYRSALCRARADWLVGINGTRLFSCLYSSTLAVGRVQSPTLAMIVSREAAVTGFVSEPFYTPEIDFHPTESAESSGTPGGNFTASGERQRDAGTAEAIRAAADGRDAVCLSVEKQKKTAAAPKLYDLTTLQREANRLFGYTAQQTLDYTQALYEKKLCSYPRTDSRFLTSGMAQGLCGLLHTVAGILPFAVNLTDSIDTACVANDAKVTDHHAIIPTMTVGGADLDALPAGERNILYMLTVRLICATATVHRYETVTAILECGGHRFTAKGQTVLQDGWKAVENAFRATLKNRPKEDVGEDGGTLPEIRKGQVFGAVAVAVKEGKTAPPRRYTEDTLLSAMETAGSEDMPEDAERKGLGTPATRAATIEKLIKSGFVERQKKSLVPTQKGINLITVLPDTLTSPLLTAEWEQKLKMVECGELAEETFMACIGDFVRGLVDANTAPVPEYASLFATVQPDSKVAKRDVCIGSCPRCGGDVIEKPKGFFCSGRDCKFALWKDNRFFTAKKKKCTKTVAAALLTEGRVFFSDLYSEKTGKTYGATVVLEDDGGKVGFKLEFDRRKN